MIKAQIDGDPDINDTSWVNYYFPICVLVL